MEKSKHYELGPFPLESWVVSFCQPTAGLYFSPPELWFGVWASALIQHSTHVHAV